MDDNITLLDIILILNLTFLFWLLKKISDNRRIKKVKGKKFYYEVETSAKKDIIETPPLIKTSN
jgi:hypothetical protein